MMSSSTLLATAVVLLFSVFQAANVTASTELPSNPIKNVVGSHSVTVSELSFDQLIRSENALMFFHGDDGPSKAFGPEYERIAELFGDMLNVRITNVNCVRSTLLCADQNAKGYDIYLYLPGEPRVKFLGVRNEEGFAKFLVKHMGDDVLDGTKLDAPRSTAAIIELTADTFKDHVSVGEHFVKFYAPWCGHCQSLASTWDELAAALEADQTVSVSKIDCTQFRPICVDYEVKGYPSLLWIVDGKRVDKYTGPRGIDDLKAYVRKTTTIQAAPTVTMVAEDGTSAPTTDGESVRRENGVLVLTTDNFEPVLAKGLVFVKFYAPWCGHCKRLAPRWEELAAKVVGEFSTAVKIAKVDCTEEDSKQVCADEEVTGFPTIFIYRDGQKLQEYNGNRSLEDLYEFVQRYASRDEL